MVSPRVQQNKEDSAAAPELATAAEPATAPSPFYGKPNLANNATIFVAPDGTGSPLGWPNSDGAKTTFTDDMVAQIENDLCIAARTSARRTADAHQGTLSVGVRLPAAMVTTHRQRIQANPRLGILEKPGTSSRSSDGLRPS